MLSTAVLHGPDSANFVIRQFGDSVTVEFIPTSSVDAHDTLTLNFDEGSRQQILLTGIGGVSQPITLSSTSVTEDTIGATVYVPIKISTSAPIAGTTIQLHYDTTMLVYRGAFEAGTPNDRTIQTSITSATIHFDGPARTKDTIIGYAAFSVYPSLTPCTTVTFDSVQFNRMPGVCIQSNSEFSADVCMPLSCGATDIGRFERYRVLPELSVTPNPAANVLWLMSSIDLGPTQIELFDIMGRHLGAYASTVSAHTAQPMNLSGIANGIYTLRVSTGSITRSVRVVVQK